MRQVPSQARNRHLRLRGHAMLNDRQVRELAAASMGMSMLNVRDLVALVRDGALKADLLDDIAVTVKARDLTQRGRDILAEHGR